MIPRGKRRASKQPLCAEALVQVRPAETETAAAHFSVSHLSRGSFEETRIPRERYGDGPASEQRRDEFVLGASRVLHPLTGIDP